MTYELKEVRPQSFIYEIKGALPPELCRDMIDRFEASPYLIPGRIGQSAEEHLSIKKSTDLRVSGREDWKDVDRGLFLSISTALNNLAEQHPFFAANSFRDSGYNMQRTGPGEHYHWHIDSGPGEFSKRQLVAIWYLNDVLPPGGETEFHHQSVKLVPRQGTLVLFPPFWTHVHRGVTVESGFKYIATTWVSLTDGDHGDRTP